MTPLIALMLNTLIQHVTGGYYLHPAVIIVVWAVVCLAKEFIVVKMGAEYERN